MHSRPNRYVTTLAVACLALLIGGCGSQAATPIPPTNAPAALQPTSTLLPATNVITSPTPLPSLTPSSTPKVAALVPTLPGSTPKVAPAVPNNTPGAIVAPTAVPTKPRTPVQATSTSALLAITSAVQLSPVPTQAALLPGVPPPLTMKLPGGWKQGFSIVPIREPLIVASMNLALYTGPISNGGTATIIVLWGFPSIGPPPTLMAPGPTNTPSAGSTALDYQSQLLWADGVRLLQGTVLDISCNAAHYDQRTFLIGGQQAIGAYFNASQCPDSPDTVGWFAGLNEYGGNYLFYVYIDPITAYNDGRGDLQKILDSVTFKPPPTQAAGTVAAKPPPTNTPAH